MGMRQALEKKIGTAIDVPEQAQICGAIGAAILGANSR
jgi:activator of 2-hydroxyglutaryl-CoA dehydratase